jgi:hypothetical protein
MPVFNYISYLRTDCDPSEPCESQTCGIVTCEDFTECLDVFTDIDGFTVANKEILITVSGIGDEFCDDCDELLNGAYPGCYPYVDGCIIDGIWYITEIGGPYVCDGAVENAAFLITLHIHPNTSFIVAIAVNWHSARFGFTDEADVIDAMTRLCNGEEIELPFIDATHPEFFLEYCDLDGASITIQMFEPGTVDCDFRPPLPPPSCEIFTDCETIGDMSALIQDFVNRSGTSVYGDSSSWSWENLNIQYTLAESSPVVTAGLCNGFAEGTTFYQALGTEGDYGDPGILIRSDVFVTNNPGKHYEVYVCGIIVVVTCEGDGVTSITKVVFAIQTFTDLFVGGWPPTTSADGGACLESHELIEVNLTGQTVFCGASDMISRLSESVTDFLGETGEFSEFKIYGTVGATP